MRQIEVGKEKGHTETEIVEAVIRGVGPGVQELHTEFNSDHSSAQASQSPKELGVAVTVKTVKGKEAKMENPNKQ